MRKKIIITTIAIISLTAVIAAKNHTPAANTNSIACTADMQKSIADKSCVSTCWQTATAKQTRM